MTRLLGYWFVALCLAVTLMSAHGGLKTKGKPIRQSHAVEDDGPNPR